MRSALGLLIAAAAVYEFGIVLPEMRLRGEVYAAARSYAYNVRKPLLNVGCPGWWKNLTGAEYTDRDADVCLELDRGKQQFCSARAQCWGSVLDIPYPSATFGAACCFHVLEHLNGPDDVYHALSELERVAERVYVLIPGRSIGATLSWDHCLWVDQVPGGYVVTDRRGDRPRQYVATRDEQPPQVAFG